MVHLRGFFRSGHWPTLLSAFLYFDVSFMIWVILGALAPFIVADFGLNAAQKGLMVAVPLLGGALLRPIFGLSTDYIGARRTAILGLLVTVLPLTLGWLWADSLGKMLVVGLLLGVAGASFAAALPLAGRWYPPQYQGLALGIAGAGNSGTVLATFFGPHLATSWGWPVVFCLALLPIFGTLVVFILVAKDSPNQPPPKTLREYALVLREHDTWWFCLFYAVTFGGFVGLASFLSIFFHDQYDLTPIQAGNCATFCLIAGSFLRPVGGYLADRLGGIRVLTLLYVGLAVMMATLTALPPLAVSLVLMVGAMGILGMGNGAVFQLVPQRFPNALGVITGVVGAAGGIGGFFLPTLLGGLKQVTGTFAGGFLIFAIVGAASAAGLVYVSRRWINEFAGQVGQVAPLMSDTAMVFAETPPIIDKLESQESFDQAVLVSRRG